VPITDEYFRNIDPPFRRTVSEALKIAQMLERETGDSPVMDRDFVCDMEEIMRNRKPWIPTAWD